LFVPEANPKNYFANFSSILTTCLLEWREKSEKV